MSHPELHRESTMTIEIRPLLLTPSDEVLVTLSPVIHCLCPVTIIASCMTTIDQRTTSIEVLSTMTVYNKQRPLRLRH